MDLLDGLEALNAVSAPRCPEIEQDHFALPFAGPERGAVRCFHDQRRHRRSELGFSRDVSTTVTAEPSGRRLSGSTKNRRPQNSNISPPIRNSPLPSILPSPLTSSPALPPRKSRRPKTPS